MHLRKYNVAMIAEWYVPTFVKGRTIITKNGGRSKLYNVLKIQKTNY